MRRATLFLILLAALVIAVMVLAHGAAARGLGV